jgi:YD repeat-containing protein
MSDLAKYKVHGPVATLRTEHAAWDFAREEWQPARGLVITSFRPDGSVSASDFHNPDGSIVHTRWAYDDAGRLMESNFQLNDGPIEGRTLYFYDDIGRHVRTVELVRDGTPADSESCTYDAAGRKTKVRFLGAVGRKVSGYGVEGSEQAYPAPGATTMTTSYDERGLPGKVVFQDANGNMVTQVAFVRDGAGRLLSEEVHLGGRSAFPELLEKAPPGERDRMAALIQKVWGGPFSATTYAYDAQGRMVERVRRSGTLRDERTTYRYEDRDDPAAATTENRNREARLDESGGVEYTPDKVTVSHGRFEYVYDAHGNWTERVVSGSNIERRAITYHI